MPTGDYRTYVTVLHPERFDVDFKSFYEDVVPLSAEARRQVRHVLDLPYGGDPHQKLDIYFPEESLQNAPVLLHVHGGGFVEGDRADYGFLALELTRRGIIVVLPSYRLCSDGHGMLDAVEDTRLAVRWVRNNIARHGGDDRSIVLSGHSAGAITTANVTADLGWLEADSIPAGFIRAAVMVSGIYNFPLDFNARNDILTSPEVKIGMSAMQHIGRPAARMILAVGSLETGPKDDYVSSAKAFSQALAAVGADVELIVMPGLNHVNSARVVGDPATPVFQALLSILQPSPKSS